MNAAIQILDSETIKSEACPRCIICGSEGEPLYGNQRDRLFGACGKWNLKKCPGRQCGLVWLDPMPLSEDIGKAYANYYTHSTVEAAGRERCLKRVLRLAKQGYWDSRYHYPAPNHSILSRWLGVLLGLSPIHRRETDAEVRFLPAVPNGRLLDVGCGSGDWLLQMNQRGWRAEGVDFDRTAVEVAKNRGLKVECGSVEVQGFADNTFDAVTLSHVIEHVPDPVGTLKECARVLKSGGRLVLFTPNADSLSHHLFKDSWRGLEPPRHLHVFSMRSMRQALGLAGFKTIRILPFIVTSVIYESILLRLNLNWFKQDIRRPVGVGILARTFKMMELCFLLWNPALADCMIVIAMKD